MPDPITPKVAEQAAKELNTKIQVTEIPMPKQSTQTQKDKKQ